MSKRFDVVIRRPGRDDKAFFHRIGTAFEGDKGINIKLDSLPLPNEKGEVWLSLYEPRERTEKALSPGSERFANDINDDIPF